MKLKALLKRLFCDRSKRGVTLVETIVAITVVTIFSVSAVSVASLATSQTSRSMHSFAAASLCNDLRQCLSVSDSVEDFYKALIACEYAQAPTDETVYAENQATVQIDRTVFYVQATVAFKDGKKSIQCTAIIPGSSKPLYELDYSVPWQAPSQDQGGN